MEALFSSADLIALKFFLEERYKDNDIYIQFIKNSKIKEDTRDTLLEQIVLEELLEKMQVVQDVEKEARLM